MPSYLPLKFHNFAAGIALAHLLLNKHMEKNSKYFIIIITFSFLIIGNRTVYIPLLFIFSWWWICNIVTTKGLVYLTLQTMFNHWTSKILADLSYSVYIIHLILMLPFFSFILKNGALSLIAWGGASLLLLSLTMCLSYLIYKFIEMPGINMGKKLLSSSV